MTLHVFTARMSYRGADRLDVTRKSGAGHALAFAPSWAILNPAIELRRVAESLRAAVQAARASGADDRVESGAIAAERIDAAAWALYVPAFRAEMLTSYRVHRASWDWLLEQCEVTLCCYCSDPARCHRRLLAGTILPKLGAVDGGERNTSR